MLDFDYAMSKGLIDSEFFTNRPTGYADPGSVYALSGHNGMYDGTSYTAHSCWRVSTRQVYRAVGIDARERAGSQLWSETKRKGLYCGEWERHERANPDVFPSRPPVDDWMADTSYQGTGQDLR
jgi:hypothetical protein